MTYGQYEAEGLPTALAIQLAAIDELTKEDE